MILDCFCKSFLLKSPTTYTDQDITLRNPSSRNIGETIKILLVYKENKEHSPVNKFYCVWYIIVPKMENWFYEVVMFGFLILIWHGYILNLTSLKTESYYSHGITIDGFLKLSCYPLIWHDYKSNLTSMV